MKLTQKILKFDTINLNDRMYTKESISKAIKEVRTKIKVLGVFYGCLGYPDADKFKLSQNVQNVSHVIKKLYIRNNILYAQIQILDTQSGRTLRENIDQFVFRPRIIGNVDNNKVCNVDEIISIDAILKDTDSYIGII